MWNRRDTSNITVKYAKVRGRQSRARQRTEHGQAGHPVYSIVNRIVSVGLMNISGGHWRHD